MKTPFQLYICCIFILLSIDLQAQRELTITEMNSDNDAVIEINSEDPNAIDFKKIMLGFNESNDGWLRMVTDHDLSFWTDSLKRLTIKNDGKIGIGTSSPESKLFIKDGRIAAETKTTNSFFPPNILVTRHSTGFDFYKDDNPQGGLFFSETNSSFSLPTVTISNINQEGIVKIQTNGQDRLEVYGEGKVRIKHLANTSNKNVYARSDGTLAVEEEDYQHMLIPTNYFTSMFSSRTFNNYSTLHTDAQLPNLNLSGLYMSPSFPFTKVYVKTLEVYYVDNHQENIRFQITTPNSTSTQIIFSSGSSSNVRTKTISIDDVIDQSNNEKISLFVDGVLDSNRTIQGAKVIYQRLY